MAKVDIEYHNLLETILKKGYLYDDPNREGVKRLEIPSYTFRHEFKDGFPAISTKKLHYKNVVTELLQFLKGNCDISYMQKNNCKIWDKDVFKFDPVGKKVMGQSYPHQWRNFGGKPKLIPRDNSKFKTNLRIEILETDVIYNTKDYGSFKIISETKDHFYNKMYNIQFIDTGYISKVRQNRVHLNLYDPYYPSIKGIACYGIFENNHLNLKLKSIWEGIISRCYNETNDNFKYYGNIGVHVSNRWKCFEYFIKDVQKLENWKEKRSNWNNYNLDKDINGNGFIYSFENCKWVSKSENILESKIKYNYTISNGFENIDFINPKSIIKQLNIKNQGNFCSMLRNERKICESWYLIKKEEIKEGVDQIANLIKGLKEKPLGTEHIVNSWNPADKHLMALPPCHYGFQIVVRPLNFNEKLDLFKDKKPLENSKEFKRTFTGENIPKYGFELHWSQRSCDVFLGIPYNIASYATLALIIEKITGYKALAVQGDLKKVHLYDNSISAVKLQLSRATDTISECNLKFKEDGEDPSGFIYNLQMGYLENKCSVSDLIEEMQIDDFILENYESYPAINIEMLERNE